MKRQKKQNKQNSPQPGLLGAPDQTDRIEELLSSAEEFALVWIEKSHGSAQDFVEAMEHRFGPRVRMHLVEIVEDLLKSDEMSLILKRYLEATLSFDALAEALGAEHGRHDDELSSLDELFQRSVSLKSSIKYTEAIDFVSKLPRYSPYNNLLVYIQNPHTTFCATETRWIKDFQRSVKKDARPLLILAPMTPVILVYDVVDTEGEPMPAWFADHFIVEGGFDVTLLDRTVSNCTRHDAIEVVEKDLGLTHGGSAIRLHPNKEKKMQIELKLGLDEKSRYAIICHELAHIYLGHLGSDKDRWWPARLNLNWNQKEMEAESVAYIVCRRLGLLTHLAEYLSGYIKDQDDLSRVSIDLVAKEAGRIERMGQRNLSERTPNATPTNTLNDKKLFQRHYRMSTLRI